MLHGVEGVDSTNMVEDNPPFRNVGHHRVSQFICHTTDAGEKITGKVVGYLRETDTDSKGGAVYFNGKGVPAKLFHVELSPLLTTRPKQIINERRLVRLCIGIQKVVSIRKILEHNLIDIRYNNCSFFQYVN